MCICMYSGLVCVCECVFASVCVCECAIVRICVHASCQVVVYTITCVHMYAAHASIGTHQSVCIHDNEAAIQHRHISIRMYT
jgi:hypothetical protein